MNDDADEKNDDDYRVNNEKTVISKSFEYKTKIIGSTLVNTNALDTEVAVTLKHLSNFLGSLDLPFINCKIEFDLSRSKDYILSEIFDTPEIDANPPSNPPIAHTPATSTTGALFQINSTKIYFPVVTLTINDNINFLGNLKLGFKRTISWNKYRS